MITTYFTSERTPDESKALAEFSEKIGKIQWQQWDRSKLLGSYLTLEDASTAIEERYAVLGFTECRLSHFSTALSETEFFNVEVRSPIDHRWMTTATFLLQIEVLS